LLLALAIGTAVALALPAAAGPRDDAKRHFRTGMELIASGENLAGIAELEAAFQILPHPNVLFNIGRAYLDAGMAEESLDNFRRYADSHPADEADVLVLIESVEAQLAAATEDARSDEPAEIEGPQLAELQALAERLERAADRLEQGGASGGAAAGQAELSPEELLEAKSLETVYDEVVVSASRQATSPLDAPVSTHIITAEDIRLSGATNIPDLLRQVPGMEVMQMGAGHTNVGVRGFNARLNNKVLVLVDGRAVWMDFLGTTFFRLLDVNLADIERIEVIRGPGSTMYGANAFSGVVNIITRPKGERSAEFGVIGGMGPTVQGNVRYSDRIKTVGYALSVGYEQTNRFELEYDPGRLDLVPNVTDPELAVRALRLNGGLTWLPRKDTQFGLSGGVASAYDDFYAIGLLRNMYMSGTFPWARADIRHKGLNARAFWNHSNAHAGPTWFAEGTLDSLETDVKANVLDVEASYGGDVQLGIPHHITVGAGFRVKTIEWGYLAEDHTERHLNGFIEDRITFAKWMSAVLGFRFDQHPLVGFTPSPRVAVIVKPTERMAFRASAGTAFRIPTFMESYLALRVPGPVTGTELITHGNTELEPELIRSVELGYRFEGSDYFMFDVAGYYQRVSNLIHLSGVTSTYDQGLDAEPFDDRFVLGTSQFENVDQAFAGFGIEPSVHVFPVAGLDISVNYAFNYLIDLQAQDAGGEARDARTPMHKVNAGVQYRSPIHLDFSVNVHVVSAYTVPERSFDDAGQVMLDPLEMDPYVILDARIVLRLLEDRLDLGVTGSNLTAFKGGGHLEHAFGTHIGPRIYGTVAYRF
jgi:iron complex outermembrane receptor protein